MSTLGILASALGGCVALLIFFLHLQNRRDMRIRRETRDRVWDDLNNSFISDMAENHLPHLYDGMKRIAAKLGIDLPDPPPIRYMPDPKDRIKR